MKTKQEQGGEDDEFLYHRPVLPTETIEALAIKPDGVYIDCTFGGGGHSRLILEKLSSKGRLIAFDQDADAKGNLPNDSRVHFVPHNFRHLQRFLKLDRIPPADGLLADLGVSSFQFDEAERGFSTRFDGALDMRMDQRQTLKASDILNTYSEERLHKLFEQYGEVSNARSLAKLISESRRLGKLTTIAQFKTMIYPLVKGNPSKYLAKVFQALRVEVNDELGALREMLTQLKDVMNNEGRVAIITFHSLEDRIVKNFFKKGDFEEEDENPFATSTSTSPFKIITKKPVTAGEEELKINPRARSAKLRVAEKTGN